MQSPAAWRIATLFALLLIQFKGANSRQNSTDLTLDQWNQLMLSLASMPMMMSTMHRIHHTQSCYNDLYYYLCRRKLHPRTSHKSNVRNSRIGSAFASIRPNIPMHERRKHTHIRQTSGDCQSNSAEYTGSGVAASFH